MHISGECLAGALQGLFGTSGHLLKIWFTLKHMGLSSNSSVEIDTSNSTPSLQRLFSCGSPEGSFYVPFAHTSRYLTMKHDAARSIIQTTIKRWVASGSVVTCDPTNFLDFSSEEGSKLKVSTGRRYPFGLGVGESGFALDDSLRVAIPIKAFAVWYGRQTSIDGEAEPSAYLVEKMLEELNITTAERELIFVKDDLQIKTQNDPLSDPEIFALCQPFINGDQDSTAELYKEDFGHYTRRVKSMVSGLDQPSWMRTSPEEDTRELLSAGAKSILLYGPPRTGKTRLIDTIMARDSTERYTIQIHDGWGYDHLIEGFKPDSNGTWGWADGPLKKAVTDGKKIIVLDEINRTSISQSLGEVFSLIEDAYRGEANGISLRSGNKFWIPQDTIFFMTMNTVDKSTEDVDDALMGRVSAVEFPPRPEDLHQMLISNGVPESIREKIAQVFVEILNIYPLGHGYFNGLSGEIEGNQVIRYYKARVRPVLMNFLGELKHQDLAKIDNIIDGMFGAR